MPDMLDFELYGRTRNGVKIKTFRDLEKNLFSSAKVRARVLNALKVTAKIALEYMLLTTEFWNDPPLFRYRITYKNASPQVFIGPDAYYGSPKGAEHWVKVNDGTSQEFVRLSNNFVPKTRIPGQIGGNTKGRGYALWSSTPRKGIVARNWSQIIASDVGSLLTDMVDAAIEIGLNS